MPTREQVKQLILRFLANEIQQEYPRLVALEADGQLDAVDSLSMVNIAVDLEDVLGIVIEDGDLVPERVRSISAFTDLLLTKVTSNSVSTVVA